jgi:2-polyprenyl-3-methyl-5-hydroxy-6-metoxy-1,4-benzoquinol methylase
MRVRRCPFCHSDSSRLVGTRVDIWVKCRNCRSVFRDITPARFQQIHDEAFQDNEYLEASVSLAGPGPRSALWEALSLPGTSVLEIGPGAGHLLAAASQAGCTVEAVESSKVHRDYIRDTWGIGSLYAAIDEIPDDRAYDAIVAINVFEHVYDIAAFLRAVRKVLAPGGTFFLSTPNGLSLEATVLRSWWPMCKAHDHVSFPSPAGVRMAARASGLRAERVWSTELPCEFPVSALTAVRDRFRARRGTEEANGDHRVQAPAGPVDAGSVNPAARPALARFYSAAGPFDPTSRLLGMLGRAASVKARLTH